MKIEIKGNCPEQFSPVADAFALNFAQELEVGASFCVCIEGQTILDIHGGYANRAAETPWTDTTIACLYSVGKAVTALLIGEAVNDGLLDYEAPIAALWPEFAANGKADISLGQVLSHQAGLPGLVEEIEPQQWLDWDFICGQAAAMAPMWPPGSASGYSPQLFGFIAGELYRRVRGHSIGTALERAGLDLYCGLAPEAQARAAKMAKPPRAPDLGDINIYTEIAFLKPWSAPAKTSREAWMAAQLPASNMHGNARAVASFLHPVANDGIDMAGNKALSKQVMDDLYRERIYGDDLVLPFTLAWTGGVMGNVNQHFGPNKKALGQAGFGGSAVVMDRDHKMTIAYVMNQMSPFLVGDPRSLRLINAVYECL